MTARAERRALPAEIELAIARQRKQFERVSKVAQIEAELEKLSQAELRKIRSLLNDLTEDGLEFTPEFESAIQESESAPS